MGVLGLWPMIDAVGHPIKLDGLEGKRLGVDANIWLYKFVRGFREKDNATSIDSHKLGLFNRICKLLFYKIKPIFVFDGPAPVLKRRTLEKRQLMRNKNVAKAQETAYKILAQQIQAQYPDAKINNFTLSKTHLTSHNLVAAEKFGDEDRELFSLPPEEKKVKEESEDEDEDNDVDANARLLLKQKDVDINSKQFNSLPPEVRYELLQDIKECRRRIVYNQLPDDANSFASFQMQRLRDRRIVQEKIEQCEKEICSMYTGETIRSYRVQSDSTSTMLYIQNTSNPEIESLMRECRSDPQSYRKLRPDLLQPGPSLEPDGELVSGPRPEKLLLPDRETDKETAQRNARAQYPDAKINNFTLSKTHPTSHNLVAEEKFGDEDRELISLSPEEEKVKEKSEDEDEDDDVDANARLLLKQKDVDINSKQFSSSPPEVRHESPQDNKECHRSIDYNQLSDDDNSFALLQPAPSVEPDGESDGESVSGPRPEILLLPDREADKETAQHNARVQYPDAKINDFTLSKTHPTSHNLVAEEKFGDEDRELISLSPEEEKVKEKSEDEDEDDDVDANARLLLKQKDVDINSKQFNSSPPEVRHESPQDNKECHRSIDYNQLPDDANSFALLQPGPSVEPNGESVSGPRPEMLLLPDREADKETARRNARVTDKVVAEAKELLRLFGVPYIDAAGEAEAQCALLEELGLTDGTITDDSDVWLFGAQTVYRHFFSDDKYVMQYKMKDIEFHIRMKRENLVCFAMLVGSDYTDGIRNVGPVTAIEILSEFPGENLDPLVKYKEFKRRYETREERIPGSKKRELLLKFDLPEGFPSQIVFDGYMNPNADSSTEEFTWGSPDLDELREYARRNFAWDNKKIDEKLLPVMKRVNERKSQPTIESFFFKTAVNKNPELFRSKRVNQALDKIAKRSAVTDDGAAVGDKIEVVQLTDDEDESSEPEARSSRQVPVASKSKARNRQSSSKTKTLKSKKKPAKKPAKKETTTTDTTILIESSDPETVDLTQSDKKPKRRRNATKI